MGVDRIAEMIAAKQAPGVVVRKNIRAGVLQDATGRQVRTIYGGENQAEVERDIVRAGEAEGIDLKTATLRLREEAGQGVGKDQAIGRRSNRLRPRPGLIKEGKSRLE
jgi:hypothetical protein